VVVVAKDTFNEGYPRKSKGYFPSSFISAEQFEGKASAGVGSIASSFTTTVVVGVVIGTGLFRQRFKVFLSKSLEGIFVNPWG